MTRLRSCCLMLMSAPFAVAAELSCPTKTIDFRDAFAGRQLVVAQGNDDVTRRATFASDNAAVAKVDVAGYVTPAGDGSATITATFGESRLAIPVKVSGFAGGRPVDFRTEVQPLLSKHGCNAGGCHGKASGQNGFKLSLFGFDAAFDHAALTREARGRRIFPAAPDHSLLLLKASGQVPHGGGRKIAKDSEAYRLLRRWIAGGAPASSPDSPSVVRLRITPGDRVFRPGQTQQLAVLAEYSDGSERDVTRQSEFAGNLDVVASVAPDGLVTAGRLSGEAAVMARYLGHVAVF